MTVSQHEVDELRRDGEALGFDGANTVLQSTAEHLGFLIAQARANGIDEPEMLDMVELLIRAVGIDRKELREARDTFAALHYSPNIIKLLTALARKAPPAPVYWQLPGRNGVRFSDRMIRSADRPTQSDPQSPTLWRKLKKPIGWR